MLNNKLISIGIIAVIVLAVIYLGNLTMKTTPGSDAGGAWQYEIMTAECFDPQKYQDCVKQKLNKNGQEG